MGDTLHVVHKIQAYVNQVPPAQHVAVAEMCKMPIQHCLQFYLFTYFIFFLLMYSLLSTVYWHPYIRTE